jgi:hypothetical protein
MENSKRQDKRLPCVLAKIVLKAFATPTASLVARFNENGRCGTFKEPPGRL